MEKDKHVLEYWLNSVMVKTPVPYMMFRCSLWSHHLFDQRSESPLDLQDLSLRGSCSDTRLCGILFLITCCFLWARRVGSGERRAFRCDTCDCFQVCFCWSFSFCRHQEVQNIVWLPVDDMPAQRKRTLFSKHPTEMLFVDSQTHGVIQILSLD